MVIAAHFEDVAKPGGAQREPRRRLFLETKGALASGHATDVLVHNVSATGLLLESTKALSLDEVIEIDLPHAGSAQARVVWASGSLFGCQFTAPISPAALSAALLRSIAPPELHFADVGDSGPRESFGARLQRLRKRRGLSMDWVATQLGVSKPTVWAWEQGKAHPVERRLDAIAEVLGVDREELIPNAVYPALAELMARSREQIATALGIAPDKIRIMIEL